MSRPQITERPAYGPGRAGSHTKTLRGPDGKERPRDRAAQRCQIYAAWWRATARAPERFTGRAGTFEGGADDFGQGAIRGCPTRTCRGEGSRRPRPCDPPSTLGMMVERHGDRVPDHGHRVVLNAGETARPWKGGTKLRLRGESGHHQASRVPDRCRRSGGRSAASSVRTCGRLTCTAIKVRSSLIASLGRVASDTLRR